MAEDDPAENLKLFSQSRHLIHKQLEQIKSRIEHLQSELKYEIEVKGEIEGDGKGVTNSSETISNIVLNKNSLQISNNELNDLIDQCCLLESQLNQINHSIKVVRDNEKENYLDIV